MKKHDAAAVEAKVRDDLRRMDAVLALDELAVTRLRLTQALRREPDLGDLLGPGIEEVDRVSRWLRELVRCSG